MRCLDSIRPWVDRMVVLDTGSTDGTADLARGGGADVHHLDWPDNFSAARNHMLDLADADWTLVIDADEWLTSGGEALRAWCDGPPRLGKICIHNGFDGLATGSVAPPTQFSRSWVSRLLPRGVRYEGRIHEQPVSPLPRGRLDLHLGHDGYLNAQVARKGERNHALLLLELQDNPDDPYILYQLGKEAERRDDYPAASGWYGKAFARTAPDANWLHELIVRHLHCLGRAGRLDEALGLVEAHMDRWEASPDFFFVFGNLLVDRAMADPAHALDQWLPLAASAWERCLEIGECPELEGSVEGRGSHLAHHNLAIMQQQMALLGS